MLVFIRAVQSLSSGNSQIAQLLSQTWLIFYQQLSYRYITTSIIYGKNKREEHDHRELKTVSNYCLYSPRPLHRSQGSISHRQAYQSTVRQPFCTKSIDSITSTTTVKEITQEIITRKNLYDVLKSFPMKSFVEAFKCYRAAYGDPWIKEEFIVPNNDPDWPEHLWNFEFGLNCRIFRVLIKKLKNKYFSNTRGKYGVVNEFFDILEELESLGFPFTIDEQNNQIVLHSFIIFKEYFGHVQVSRKFIIPDNFYITKYSDPSFYYMKYTYKNRCLSISDKYSIISNPWPRAAWGLRLGKIVNNIKMRGVYGDIHDYLQVLGFPFHRLTQRWKPEDIVLALTTYKSIYNHVILSDDYVIPSDDSKYAEHIRGMKLGSVVRTMVFYNSYSSHRDEFEELGIIYRVDRNGKRFEQPIPRRKRIRIDLPTVDPSEMLQTSTETSS